MERYIDRYGLVVPDDKIDRSREMADEAGQLWIEHGAPEYFNGVGKERGPDLNGHVWGIMRSVRGQIHEKLQGGV